MAPDDALPRPRRRERAGKLLQTSMQSFWREWGARNCFAYSRRWALGESFASECSADSRELGVSMWRLRTRGGMPRCLEFREPHAGAYCCLSLVMQRCISGPGWDAGSAGKPITGAVGLAVPWVRLAQLNVTGTRAPCGGCRARERSGRTSQDREDPLLRRLRGRDPVPVLGFLSPTAMQFISGCNVGPSPLALALDV
jgi:hypothetical protein